MGGSSTAATTGEYGHIGVFSEGNAPGSRYFTRGWADKNGMIWLLSGTGLGSSGAQGGLNDLWAFDPAVGAAGEWAWMHGSDAVGTVNCTNGCGWPGVYGQQDQFSPSNTPGSRGHAASWTDDKGYLWLFGGLGLAQNGAFIYLNDLWEYIPPSPPKSQSITFTQPISSVRYGAHPIQLSAKSSSGLPVVFTVVSGPGNVASGTSALQLTGAGTVVVGAMQPGNAQYAGSIEVTHSVSVLKAPLTVTADNLTMTYGDPLPKLTFSATGFVNGDTLASLSGQPDITVNAGATPDIGSYPISISAGTLASPNYNFFFKGGTLTVKPVGKVVAPVIKPASGIYRTGKQVTITDATPGAAIYYTTDGSKPSATNGTQYAGAFTISQSEIVKAIAVKTGYTSSSIVTANYTIQ
jgi:hypothetical protein